MYVQWNGLLDENKANRLVKSELIELGYSPDLEIKSYISDDKISYLIYDTFLYHGENVKKITDLKSVVYNQLLIASISKFNNNAYQVNTVITSGKVKYVVTELTYPKRLLQKKRRLK